MAKLEFSSDKDIQSDDWEDDSDFDLPDFPDDPDDEDDLMNDGLSNIASKSRLKAMRAGIEARRTIEQIKEQIALNKELNDFDDYLI